MGAEDKLIPEEKFEEIAKTVPDALKTGDGKLKYASFNERFAKMKQLNVLHWLILVGKLRGWSDRELAEKIGCHECTVAKHRRRIQKSDWIQNIAAELMDLAPLFKESLRVLALKADAFTTVKFFEGMGVFSQRHEVSHKVDPNELQKRMLQNMDNILGVKVQKPQSRIAGLIGDNGGED